MNLFQIRNGVCVCARDTQIRTTVLISFYQDNVFNCCGESNNINIQQQTDAYYAGLLMVIDPICGVNDILSIHSN